MKLNDRARKAVTEVVDGAEVEALVAFSHLAGAASAHNGIVQGGASILGHAYAVERGIDLDDPRLRADLLQAWCAVTPTELVFCKPNPWAVRPKPGKVVDRIDRAGITLAWADIEGLSTVTRLTHLEFPDGRHLLTSTLIRARIRRQNYNDEADLMLQSFGPQATELVLP